LTVWQIYRGIVTLVDFSWELRTFQIYYTAMNHILMFIPMCLVILIIFEFLFTCRDMGSSAVSFFRMLFTLFLVTFVILGVILSRVDANGENDADRSLSLWCAWTDLILAIFFALPAPTLLDVITAPMRQVDDIRCLNICKIGTVLYVALFGGRAIWNGSHYFNVNSIQKWLVESPNAVVKYGAEGAERPSSRARALIFMFVLLFDLSTSVLSMGTVYLFKKHELTFNDPLYA
jgi:hypothetical protein